MIRFLNYAKLPAESFTKNLMVCVIVAIAVQIRVTMVLVIVNLALSQNLMLYLIMLVHNTASRLVLLNQHALQDCFCNPVLVRKLVFLDKLPVVIFLIHQIQLLSHIKATL